MTLFVSWLTPLILLATFPQDGAQKDPEPTKEEKVERLKLIKNIFKDEYSRRSSKDRQVLAEKLLLKGLETKDDPPARFVLLTEAGETAAAAGDVATAIQAADALGQSFEVDGLALKLDILGKALKSAKDPESARLGARAFLDVGEQAVRKEDWKTAQSAASKAKTLARAARDPLLPRTVQEFSRDISTLKSEHGRVKKSLENPTEKPTDGLGRYLAFVRGDWDLGIEVLAAAGRGSLKTLAGKDQANPAGAGEQAAIGEGWWELAKKEKSPWKKREITRRAEYWLDQAFPQSTGLTKTRVEKLLSDIAEASPGEVNLLRFIDPKWEAIGEWAFAGRALTCEPADPARLMIPYTPPDEYEVTAVVERTFGADAIMFGLVKGPAQFCVWIDGFSNLGCRSGLDMIDNQTLERIPTTHEGPLLTNNQKSTIVVSVRKGRIFGSVDGRTFLDWSGNTNRLSTHVVYKPTDKKALFLVSWGSKFTITKLSIRPLVGKGKRLR